MALFAVSAVLLLFLRFYVHQPVTGDEPHYLLMDYSLIHDHDLNLKNNFAHRDYWSFYPHVIKPAGQIPTDQLSGGSAKWYSIHSVGLPLILVPAFWLGGPGGASVFMALAAAAVIWLTFRWCLRLTRSLRLSLAASLALLICWFFNGLAGYVYPDLIIAGLTLLSLIIVEKYYDKPKHQFVLGAAAGLLILEHFKALVISGPLMLALFAKSWWQGKKIPWWALASFVPLFLYFLLSNHGWFGVWNPADIYTGFYFGPSSPPMTITALLFDSVRGLFVYNPVLLLIVVGLPIWYKKNRDSLALTLLVALPYLAVVADFSGWRAGTSPTGRYLMDVLPVFIPSLAFALGGLKRHWQKSVVWVLVVLTILITLNATLTRRPYTVADGRSPLFVQIQDHTGLRLDRYLPRLTASNTFASRHGTLKAAADYALILGLFGYGVILARGTDKGKKLTARGLGR